MIKKQILRCIGFMLCVVMLTVLMCDLFECSNEGTGDKNIYTYRNLPENTVDAVFLGTSGVDRYWIAPKAYEEHGIALYSISYDGFVSWLYTNLMDEVLSQQDLKLIIIDLRPFYQNNVDPENMDSRARLFLDSLPVFNSNRIKTAFKVMDIMHEADEENPSFDASYLLPFIKFHTKWAEDYSLNENLGSKEQLYGSFYMQKTLSIRSTPQNKVVFKSDMYEDLDPLCEHSLYEVIDYVNEKDINVLFIDTPQFISERENGRANTVYKILEENNMDYISFYKQDSSDFIIDLDNNHDFYNESHVNYYGAEKFTASLAQYLTNNYDLPDSRKNPNASEFWNGKYDKVKEEIAYFEKLKAEKDAAKK